MTAAPRLVMTTLATTLLGAGLVALGPVSMALYTPAMPQLALEFGTTEAMIKLTLTAYFAGFAVTQLACGPLTDAFGRRPVTIVFLGLYLASTVLATFASDTTSMLFARSLQGIGAAVGVTVARAIVRDQYTGQNAARIMNTIATMLALGPALSPTIGGFILEWFGWREIFVCMLVYGGVLLLSVLLFQKETNAYRDLGNLKPRRLIFNYATLLKDPRFLRPSIMVGLSLGNFYTLASVLPFVLIHNVGLTPSQFGVGMMMQSFSFIAGTLVTGRLLKRMDADRLVPYGLFGMLLSATVLAVILRVYEPTYLIVMIPVAMFAFAVAAVLPSSFTSAMRDFPHIAGAASSMMGFLQFGAGILGSLAIAAIGDPVTGLATVIPAMPAIGALTYISLGRFVRPSPAAAE